VLFITRRNMFTRLLVGRWWQSNLYTAPELTTAFRAAGFSAFSFRSFPRSRDEWRSGDISLKPHREAKLAHLGLSLGQATADLASP
jgi:hypothetical protein